MTPSETLQDSGPQEQRGEQTRSLANELRTRELADRLRWFVITRWYAVVLCLGGALVAYLRWLPAPMNNNIGIDNIKLIREARRAVRPH